jgi:hypothetical protein
MNYCEVIESVCNIDPCPVKHFCIKNGFTKPLAYSRLPHHLKDWSREEEKNKK